MKNEEQTIKDYHRAFSHAQTAIEAMKLEGIGDGVSAVVMFRHAAILCRMTGIGEDEFAKFAKEQYRMIVECVDEHLEEKERKENDE